MDTWTQTKRRGALCVACSLVCLAGCPGRFPERGLAPPPPPPGEPPTSLPPLPGSAQYPHAGVRQTAFGEGAQAFFIYEPADPAPASAPVIVFLHGHTAVNPGVYGGWLEHLVRRGNIVIFPVYQAERDDPLTYSPNTLAAVQSAYAELASEDHVRPDEVHLAVIGHSLGCVLAMNLAAVAPRSGLPTVQAILLAHAGDGERIFPGLPSLRTEDYGEIPADVLFLGVVGSADTVVDPQITLELYGAIGHVPQANREVVELFSDDYGEPDLVAGHGAPLASDPAFDSGETRLGGFFTLADLRNTNTLDWNGYWKFLDGLCDAAFFSVHREFALGGTPEQENLGAWSDGRPVNPAQRIRPSAGN